MNSFLTGWGKDLKRIPVGPLGVIAMAGCEEMGEKIDAILTRYEHLYNKKVFIEFYVKNKLLFDLSYELQEDYISIMHRIEDVEDFIAKNLSD